MKKTTQAGFSTLELLIAFTVMTLGLTAVTMVAFSNQALTIDTELENRALYIAERGLENAYASAVADFSSLASLFTVASADENYDKELAVTDVSECVKRIESSASWQIGSRNQQTTLSTIVVDKEASAALGHDCETEEINNGWDSPEPYGFSDPIHPGSQGTDVDVVTYKGSTYAFVTTESSGDGLWLVDVTDPEDNNPFFDSADSGSDLNAVDAYVDESGVAYVFVASAASGAQLQVFEVDLDSASKNLNPIVTAPLPGVGGSNPGAISIFYYSDRVYIGTGYLPCPGSCLPSQNNEFHVFDVSDPTLPVWEGSVNVNHIVNDIHVTGDWAYIATSDNSGEFMAININSVDPEYLDHPDDTGYVFNAPGNQDGTSVYVAGNKAYLGRARAQASHDFHILDISNVETSIASLGSIDLDINPNTEVVGIVVHSNLAFISTTDSTPNNGGGPFMVYSVVDPNAITLVSTCALNYSEVATGLDFANGVAYVSNRTNDKLRIIYPAPMCS